MSKITLNNNHLCVGTLAILHYKRIVLALYDLIECKATVLRASNRVFHNKQFCEALADLKVDFHTLLLYTSNTD